MKGNFSRETVQAYIQNDGPKFAEETVIYYLPYEMTPEPYRYPEACRWAESGGRVCTVCPSTLFSILYMDVGLWAGNGGGGTNWPKSRDFGVVSGNAAALCSFVDPKPGEDQRGPITEEESNQSTDKMAIKTLLDYINDYINNNPPTTLGTVKLRKILLWSEVNKIQRSALGDRIYVFLGDMHFPVMDKFTRSVRQGRHGRMSLFDKNLTADSDRILPGQMTDDEGEDWIKKYNGSSNILGADIFQSAGQDLSNFLTVLQSYQQSPHARAIHIIQTGDLFDFWIGFVNYFEQHDNDVVFSSQWDKQC